MWGQVLTIHFFWRGWLVWNSEISFAKIPEYNTGSAWLLVSSNYIHNCDVNRRKPLWSTYFKLTQHNPNMAVKHSEKVLLHVCTLIGHNTLTSQLFEEIHVPTQYLCSASPRLTDIASLVSLIQDLSAVLSEIPASTSLKLKAGVNLIASH